MRGFHTWRRDQLALQQQRDAAPKTFTFSRQCRVCRAMHTSTTQASATEAIAQVERHFHHENVCKVCWTGRAA